MDWITVTGRHLIACPWCRVWKTLLLPLALPALLSGCFGSEDLLQAPRPAVQYQHLQAQIDVLLANGYTYSAPASGDHRQAVLMADLTGDGKEEAIVFLRGEAEILLTVFRPRDGGFTALPPIAENAESLHSVAFCDLNGDGEQEIIVGWQAGALRMLSVYALEDGGLTELFTRRFSAYTVYDIVDDGAPALLIVQADSAEQVVEMITDQNGGLALASAAHLSRGAEAVKRIRTGPLLDGRPGLLVTSQYQTSAGEITDVLTFRDGGLVNISANMETGVSDGLVRQREIFATDINGDGVLNLPHPVELPGYPGDEEVFYEIRWTAYDSNGLSAETARTYHSVRNDWYILLPESWPGRYTVRRASGPAQTVTTFSLLTGDEVLEDFLRIYYITLPAGDRPPVRGHAVLAEQDNLLVTAEIIPPGDGGYTVREAELKEHMFRLIPPDWRGP